MKRPSVLPLKEKRVYEWGGMTYGQGESRPSPELIRKVPDVSL